MASVLNSLPPAWKFQYSSIGHRWSAGSIRRIDPTVGIAGPGPISVAKLNAPPTSLSRSQYDGATKSYGPFILTPESPVTVVGVAVADDTYGTAHFAAFSVSRYIRSTSGGGGLSLPLSHVNTDGCRRILSACDHRQWFAMSRSAGVHLSHISQWSQQHQPAITRIPISSHRSRNSSDSILPSSRTVFRFMSRTY